jgi:hypothetical protein
MLIFVMVLIFLLGFPFEWIEICLIVLPVFAPILAKMDFSGHIGDKTWFMPWFATLVAANLQTSFMSPPFGATLFYMKGTVPPDCSMTDVYRGMYPFLIIQIIGLFLAFPFRACPCGCRKSRDCLTERDRQRPARLEFVLRGWRTVHASFPACIRRGPGGRFRSAARFGPDPQGRHAFRSQGARSDLERRLHRAQSRLHAL